MYDRKTWVVLALCGGLLAANVYYTSKNAERVRQQTPPQSPTAHAEAPATPAVNAQLSVEPPAPPAKEELITLESKEVIFTLSSIGGGIKHAEFKHQHKVRDKTQLVRVNHNGAGPIGGLAGVGENLENIPYAYKAEDSIAGETAVFIAKLPSGLYAKKTFSLVKSDKPGAPYLLDFRLELENPAAAANSVNLNQWSLFLGEASPLYQAETPDQTGFFWRESGDMHFKAGTSFKGGMFWGSAQSVIKSDSDSPVEFAGVTNQFFATVVRPKEPSIANVWGKSS